MPAASLDPIRPLTPISGQRGRVVAVLTKIAAVTGRILANRWTKAAVFIACLVPLAAEVVGWFGWLGQDLGFNPIEDVTHETGEWALKFLIFALAVTPLRKLLRIPELIRYRRMLGLYAFFYSVVHLYTYVWMDKFFDLDEILHDIVARLFITVGVISFVLLLPLALTSTPGWIARMGGARWRWMHRLIYLSAGLAILHYYWVMKVDVSDPLMYAEILAALLVLRAYLAWDVSKRYERILGTEKP